MEGQNTPRKIQCDVRERRIAELARVNPEYAYICDKKHPDPGLPYGAWIKKIIDENRI